MNLEIRYLMLPVRDREASVQFFTEKLGFQVDAGIKIRDNECTAIRVSEGGPYLVLEEVANYIAPEDSYGRVVLNTDDCLRDYYRLRTLGVNFINKPEYLSVGLSVQFKDPSGNVFALFEQRDYSN